MLEKLKIARAVIEGFVILSLALFFGSAQVLKYSQARKAEGREEMAAPVKEVFGAVPIETPAELKKELQNFETKKKQEGYNIALQQVWDSLKNEGQFTLSLTQGGQVQQVTLIPKPQLPPKGKAAKNP